jgi:hypothetical protein
LDLTPIPDIFRRAQTLRRSPLLNSLTREISRAPARPNQH